MANPIHSITHPFHTQTGRVYSGRLNHFKYAVDDHIVVIFHNTIAVAQPVSLYWQFSDTNAGKKKLNQDYDGYVDGMERTASGYKLLISGKDQYYRFAADMDERSMTLKMMNPNGVIGDDRPTILQLVWPRY
ncbi:hypothetical protein BDZ91DRAFT_726666 [Kalaharituber pfeilii]|nr:hypothetical protein BDZ91DRAFT_726666 [Kalaharituber pfeilii]